MLKINTNPFLLRTILLPIAAILATSGAFAQKLPKHLFRQVNVSKMQLWADSVYNTLSDEERLAQLIMPIVYPSADAERISREEGRVRRYKWGGILYQKGLLADQLAMNRRLQNISQVPMLIALDGEWGLYMRLKDAPRYPRNLGLGLNAQDQIVYNYAREVARQCRLMGIHINFAPTVDVNINPLNPVIGSRSFGSDPGAVSRMSIAYAEGLEDGGVLSVAKHFPGHGDTSEDSHKTLPIVGADRKRLDRVELRPFRDYIKGGLGGVMTAHLQVPALDASRTTSSLSSRIVTDLLQTEMGFSGLIFTDGLEMRGVHVGAKGDVGVAALKAGNDILLGPINPERQLQSLLVALQSGELSNAELKKKVMKVLYYKYRLIISQSAPTATPFDIKKRIWTPEAELEKQKLWLNSLYYLQSTDRDFGAFLQKVRSKNIAVLDYGTNPVRSLMRPINTRDGGGIVYLPFEGFERRAKDYDFVLINAFNSKIPPHLVQNIARTCPTALVYYTTPFKVKRAEWMSSLRAVILTMEAAKEAQEAIFSLLIEDTPRLGDEVQSKRTEEVHIDEDPTQQQIQRETSVKLPNLRDAGLKTYRNINVSKLERLVDQIVSEGLREGAFPGCQVYVMQRGQEVLNKSYGVLGDVPSKSVDKSTLYDVASISKALATTPAIMALVDDKKINLDAPLSAYLEEFKGSYAGSVSIRNLLLHQSGLPPGLPFINRLFSPVVDPEGLTYYARERDNLYDLRLSRNYFVRKDFRKVMTDMIASSTPRRPGQYVYSDLNFILLGWVVERLSGQSLDRYLSTRILEPLNAQLYYNPLDKGIPLERIAPTQRYDDVRGEQIRATVDDESAACLGGVAGNAGIYSSAQELAKVAQLFLTNGALGNKQVISSKVIDTFMSSRGVGGVRTLGFIRPQVGKQSNQAAESASSQAIGHYGFTGTAVWIDPLDQLVFVFLSNRTYRGRKNTLISRNRYRPRLHQAVYDAMKL